MRVRVGPVDWVPSQTCIAVGDGRAAVIRVGDQIHAFRNRCLHQDSRLDGGIVRDGVLSCPFHFWRYRVESGQLIGSRRSLERFAVDVVDGVAYVLIPDGDDDPRPLRERLLERARQWDRETAYRVDVQRAAPSDSTTSASETGPKSS